MIDDHNSLLPAMTCQVNFEAPAHLQEKRKKAARWAPNPEEGWGPKRRAGRGVVVMDDGGDMLCIDFLY